jgi:hypothetical protein
MCYFSAEGHSREAREDEALIVRRQPHGSTWLISSEDASTPVCLKTGTEVELLYVPEKTQRRFGLTQEATAMFETNHWWWPDLFVFKNGRRVAVEKATGRASGSGALGTDSCRPQGGQQRAGTDKFRGRSGN